MPTFPDLQFDPISLSRQTSPGSYARGTAVFSHRLVRDCRVGHQAATSQGDAWVIEGEVEGSAGAPYSTRVVLEVDTTGRVLRFDGDCSCPVGVDCKHSVALALQARRVALAESTARSRPGTAKAPAPHTQVLQALQAPQARAVEQWLARFELAAPQAAALSPPPASSHSVDLIVFLLQLGRPAPLLSWGMSRPLKRGNGWTQVKTVNFLPLPPTGEHSATHECVHLIRALGYPSSSTQGTLQGQSGLLALRLAAQTGRLFVADEQGDIDGAPLRWGPERALAWSWTQAPARSGQPEAAWTLSARLAEGDGQILPGPPPWYLDRAANQCGPALAAGIPERNLALLLAAPPIAQSVFDRQPAALLTRLAGLPLPPTVVPAEPLQGVVPTAHLHIAPVPAPQRATLGPLCATLTFDYAGLRCYWAHQQGCMLADRDGRRVLLQRDLTAELAARAALLRLGLLDDGAGLHYLPPAQAGVTSPWLDWAVQDFAQLREDGFAITQDDALHGFIQQSGALDVRLTGADGQPWQPHGGMGDTSDTSDMQGGAGGAASPWFDLSLGIEIDGVRQNVLPWLPDLLAQLQATPEGSALPDWVWRQREDGGYVRLPSAPLKPWLQALLDLVGDHALDGEGLRLSRLETLRLGAALGDGVEWAGAAQLRELLRQLAGRAQLPEAPVPQSLVAELRPYQRHGLSWLQFLRAQGLGGILADDMGLGKTLQTLAHVLAEQEAGRLDRPALVIAPVSLLGNWQREAARFAPTLRTVVWHGLARHDAAQDIARSDLVIAPYSLLQRDRALWLEQPWHVVVLDEAQNIKNASTHAARAVAQLDARHRLCLSGTPLENHLGELWSLFHFLMPGFLGSQAGFAKHFRTPIEKHGDPDRLDQLRRRVTPFLLRRSKSEVAKDLPEKVDNLTTIALAGAQADLYETVRLATEKAVRDALADKGLARSQIHILDALLKLRQVCCDPRLLGDKVPSARNGAPSAKLEWLMEQLPEMLAEGRRVLLFSQFTSMLTLIEAGLKERGLAWTKLTGQTQQREKAIARFTEGEVPLFLISLKAGGTGLNLPQADTVIHYDPWWNPAVEDQATGRAHRIGQKNTVFVYKLVAEGTIEERILALQARKAGLAESLYEGAAARREPLFTENDVAELLRPMA
ncbi:MULTISPECIES: DEAD/DEAH box helicase [unclassified Acidovorax]|uniref:DEAD/DEAH box helicase n=1 Tax=unclassified Acidovorax TaxID=2684926 RepID=UPI002883007F|nr:MULTISPECIES: DEAD/DEAH box helicase [unclassified Acidovorax]